MRTQLLFSLLATFGLAACADSTSSYRNALTGESCEPDVSTYLPREPPPQCQGTSNGDNCDDLHSGKIDCIGDGNSGQGDDRKHPCFPQPGCDDQGCCDDDLVDPPDESDPDNDEGDPPVPDVE